MGATVRVLTTVLKFTFKIAGIILGACVGAAVGFALAMVAGYYFIGQAAILVMLPAMFIGGFIGAIAGYFVSSSMWTRAYESVIFWKCWFFPPAPHDDGAA
jgi:hypothetical protein